MFTTVMSNGVSVPQLLTEAFSVLSIRYPLSPVYGPSGAPEPLQYVFTYQVPLPPVHHPTALCPEAYALHPVGPMSGANRFLRGNVESGIPGIGHPAVRCTGQTAGTLAEVQTTWPC